MPKVTGDQNNHLDENSVRQRFGFPGVTYHLIQEQRAMRYKDLLSMLHTPCAKLQVVEVECNPEIAGHLLNMASISDRRLSGNFNHPTFIIPGFEIKLALSCEGSYGIE